MHAVSNKRQCDYFVNPNFRVLIKITTRKKAGQFIWGEKIYVCKGKGPKFRPKLTVEKTLLTATCQGQTI